MKKSKNYIYYFATAFLCAFLLVTEVIAEEANCPLGPNVTRDLYGVLKIMKIAAPLLCIGFSAWDAVRAVAKGEADSEIKKVAGKFGKRMMYAVILFFIPVIVEAVLSIADITSGCDLQNPASNGSEMTAEESKHCSSFSKEKCLRNTEVCVWESNSCKRKSDVSEDDERESLTEDCSNSYKSRSECGRENFHNKQCKWDAANDKCINR